MQLHNRLSQLFQKETDRVLKGLFNDNPDLLKKYVDGGLIAVGAVLAPVNAFMRHLLTVQGLDPDSHPGDANRALIQEAIEAVFEKFHEKDFEDDYDVSWAHNKFGAVQNKLNMTQDRFMALTDLSKVDSAPPVLSRVKFDELVQIANPVAPESEKRETPITPGVSIDEEGVRTYSQDAIQVLKDFVSSIEAEKKAEKKDAPKEESKPTGKKTLELKVTKKKLNKKSGRGPKVNRIPATRPPYDETNSTLKVESDRIVRPSSKRIPGRDFAGMAAQKRAEIKAAEQAAKEADPVFQAEAKAKLVRATELTNLMITKGLVINDEKSRQDQIDSMKNWSDNNFDALERVVTKYGPTTDAIKENKFKGSFRRTERKV